MILRPVVSEKAIDLADKTNTYAFFVPRNANKDTIAKAVSARFSVKVDRVRTQLVKGKAKQMPVRRGKIVIKGIRQTKKKAYVTVAENDKITIFEGSE